MKSFYFEFQIRVASHLGQQKIYKMGMLK